MSDKWNNFIKKNLTIVHIIGIVLGWIFAFIYWYKVGYESDNILKNNPFLISIWGIALGYITFDLIISSKRREDDKDNGDQ
ncbi:hypothetical protein LJC68_10295 [Bacteroidales bacterium OttesenSCG-928-B11]|nr:hypothetical protein [Bacteroidales bacterium OttesenSCG-928-B11]